MRYRIAGADSVRRPDRIIAGPRTALCEPSDIARGPDGRLYVLNHAPWYSDVGPTTDRVMSWVTVYDSAARGDAAPVRTLNVQPRDLRKAISIGVDRSGQLYVGYGVEQRVDSGTIAIFAPDADGDAEPVRVLHGLRNGLRLPNALAVDSRGYLYVTNTQRFGLDHAVRVFAPGAAGDAMPCRVIEGPRTGLRRPGGLAVDGDDRLYVGNQERSSLASSSSITVYDARVSGDVAPARILAEGVRSDGMAGPERLAVDSHDSLFVRSVGTLSVFAPRAHDAMEPARSIFFPQEVRPPPARTAVVIAGMEPRAPRLASAPRLFALDRQDRMFVVWGDTVKVYAAGFTGGERPVRSIAGPATGIHEVSAIAVDRRGALYLADRDSSLIRVYAPGAAGNAAPRRTIGGPRTRVVQPNNLTVDAAGQLYVASFYRREPGGAIVVYATDANGDDEPVRVLAGPATRLTEPRDLEFDSLGNLYVASGEVLVFRHGASGDEAPVRSVGGKFGLHGAAVLAFGARDTLYVLNLRSHTGRCEGVWKGDSATVAVYGPGARSSEESIRTLVLKPDGRSPGRQHAMGLLRGLVPAAGGAIRLWHPEGSTLRSATAPGEPSRTILEEAVPGSDAAGLDIPGDGWVYATNIPGERRCRR